MKQALHIALKDLRHIWPETVISLLLTIAFAIVYPDQWRVARAGYVVAGGGIGIEPHFLSFLLVVLIPVSWYLLIGRIVHDESLVGDRQFWLTRPYRWTNLLGAKFLFLAALLYLPVLLMHCWLLSQAGFSPFAYLPGLLYNLLLISVIIVLPLFAIASVTSSFSRMALTLIAALLCFLAAGALYSAAGIDHINSGTDDLVSLPLLFCACATVILMQYAARRVWLSRIVLAVLVVALASISAVVGSGALMDHTYPKDTAAASPVHLVFDPAERHHPSANLTGNQKGIPLITISVPLQISGLAASNAWADDDLKVSIESEHGNWQSEWQMHGARLRPDETLLSVPFRMSKPDFKRFQAEPVTLHLTFAYTLLEGRQPVTIAMPDHDFSVSGFGVCSPRAGWFTPVLFTNLECRSALRNPHLTYAETRWSDSPCPTSSQVSAQDGVLGAGWTGDLSERPAQFSITSVWQNPLNLSNRSRDDGPGPSRKPPRHICPGTPIAFTEYHVQHRGQFTVTIPNFQMPAESTAAGGAFGFGAASSDSAIGVGR